MIKQAKKHTWDRYRIALRLFSVMFFFSVFSSSALCNPHELELFATPQTSTRSGHNLDEKTIRQREVKINFGLLNSAMRRRSDAIIFNCFDDVPDVGSIEKTIIRSHDSYSILGSLNYEKEGSFIITVKNDVALGNIHTPDGKHYMIHYTGDGHVVRQIDDSSFAGCAMDELGAQTTDPVEQSAPMDTTLLDDASTFDVLVVYTAVARAAQGGTTAMEALIDLAVDEANAGYANSLITPRIRLVHTEEVSYSEASGFETALDDLTNNFDGKMDNVHALRDLYGADFVCLLIDNPDYCGIAWLMQTLSPSFESNAFSVVAYDCATGYYSFAHELGHNMGCAHATPESPQGEGLYNYSMGWRFVTATNQKYRTIMAYDLNNQNYIRKNYFSNPDVSYAGYPTGVPLGQSNEAHNALTINNVASMVANFRQSMSDSPPVANDSSEIVTVNTPQTIQVDAADEGLPDPPGVLDIIIVTLPSNGKIEDNNGDIINGVPYTLPGNSSTVRYIPDGGFIGTDYVQFKANDSVADSNIGTVTIDVLTDIYVADMDIDPGFTFEGQWAWGQPSGGGGSYGNPDPTSGFTGLNVIGYKLSGNYKKLRSIEWVTTPAMDCSDVTNTTLEFYRWLNVEQPLYDHAYIEVSNDASSWVQIWENIAEITDSVWQKQSFDISTVADGEAAVYVRWGMGTTDARWHYSGWNIDDITIKGVRTVFTGDIDGNNKVDALDFGILSSQWRNSGCVDPGRCNGADIIKDGTVDMYDLLAMINYWLDTSP